jgi:hypothetical protein
VTVNFPDKALEHIVKMIEILSGKRYVGYEYVKSKGGCPMG